MMNGIERPLLDAAAAHAEDLALMAKHLVDVMLKAAVFSAIAENPDAFGLDTNCSLLDAMGVVYEEMNNPCVHEFVREALEANLSLSAEKLASRSLTPDRWREVTLAMLSHLQPPVPGRPAN